RRSVRLVMPWYWSDEVAIVLQSSGRLDAETAAALIATPVAFRRDAETLEEVAIELAEEGEVPLAA
ncbi:MAG: hypothetical protein PVG83_09750, partial [Acidimicrobiia bacterium]